MDTLFGRALFWLISGIVRIGFRFFRLLESVLPQEVLSIIVWPVAILWSLTESDKRRRVTEAWRRFPESFRPDRVDYYLIQTFGLTHARFIYLWADRLPRAHWRRRCILRGHYDSEKLRRPTKPIIFVTLHFGPSQVLFVCLRAHGIPVTVLVGPEKEPRQRLRQQFVNLKLSAPVDIPPVLPATDIGRIRRNLVPGRFLLVSMDVDRGKQIRTTIDGQSFRLATGPLRLASVLGAEVIPCLICFEKGAWKVAIHFGAPVPPGYLNGSLNLEAAVNHILGEFWPLIHSNPSQVSHKLLSCMNVDDTPAVREATDDELLASLPYFT